MDKVNVFILSEDGTILSDDAFELIKQSITGSGKYEIANAPEMNHILMKEGFENGMPIGNALNDPLYLLGEIEESEYPVVVVPWDEDDDGIPIPRFLFGTDIDSLTSALGESDGDDAWEIAVNVHKELRNN